VQVMQTPDSVASHLHIPIIRLQQHAIIPFIITQHEHMPPAIIVQRFCTIPAETLSSHTQVIFIPPAHLAIVIVHRGTITMFVPAGVVDGAPIIPAVPAIPIPGIAIPTRSFIIAVDIVSPPRCHILSSRHPARHRHILPSRAPA
jgi:hypothetical protein